MMPDGEEGANPINPSHPRVGTPLLEGTTGSETDNFSIRPRLPYIRLTLVGCIGSAADITLTSLNKMSQNSQPLTTYFCIKRD